MPLPPVTGTVELAPATVPFEAVPPVVAVTGLFAGVVVGEDVLVAIAEAAGDFLDVAALAFCASFACCCSFPVCTFAGCPWT